jgi:hypothetical protein
MFIFSDRANSVTDACSPVSRRLFQRWARANALTRVLSTMALGRDQARPSGVITSLRPPRFRIVRGTRTVKLRPSRAQLT